MGCTADRTEANTTLYTYVQISYYYYNHHRECGGGVRLKIQTRTYKPNYKTYSDCIQLRKYDNSLNIFGRRSITSPRRTEVCDTRREGRACNGPTRNGLAACSRQSLFDCRPDWRPFSTAATILTAALHTKYIHNDISEFISIVCTQVWIFTRILQGYELHHTLWRGSYWFRLGNWFDV